MQFVKSEHQACAPFFSRLKYEHSHISSEEEKTVSPKDNNIEWETSFIYRHQCCHAFHCDLTDIDPYCSEEVSEVDILNEAATIIQATWRGYITRKNLYQLYNAAVTIQSLFWEYRARKLHRLKNADTSIQMSRKSSKIRHNINQFKLASVQKSALKRSCNNVYITVRPNSTHSFMLSPVKIQNPSFICQYFKNYRRPEQWQRYSKAVLYFTKHMPKKDMHPYRNAQFNMPMEEKRYQPAEVPKFRKISPSVSPSVFDIFEIHIADIYIGKLPAKASVSSNHYKNESTKLQGLVSFSNSIHSNYYQNGILKDIQKDRTVSLNKTMDPVQMLYSDITENTGNRRKGLKECNKDGKYGRDDALYTETDQKMINLDNALEISNEKFHFKSMTTHQDLPPSAVEKKVLRENGIKMIETYDKTIRDQEQEVYSAIAETKSTDNGENVSDIQYLNISETPSKMLESKMTYSSTQSTETHIGVRQSDIRIAEYPKKHIDNVDDEIYIALTNTEKKTIEQKQTSDVNEVAGVKDKMKVESATKVSSIRYETDEKRMLEAEKDYQQLVNVAVIIQAYWRGFKIRNDLKKHRAALTIQSLFRSYRVRKQLFAAEIVKKNPLKKEALVFENPLADSTARAADKDTSKIPSDSDHQKQFSQGLLNNLSARRLRNVLMMYLNKSRV